jgi:hypothetical protein
MLLKIQEVVPRILENIDLNCASSLSLILLSDPILIIVMLGKEIASNLSEDTFSG